MLRAQVQPVAAPLVADFEQFGPFAQAASHVIHSQLSDQGLEPGSGGHDSIHAFPSAEADRVGRDRTDVQPMGSGR